MSAMTVASGARLSSYEILRPPGACGMVEVYRAQDPRLGRPVALTLARDVPRPLRVVSRLSAMKK